MINARVFRAGEELTDVPVEDLSELRSEPGTLVWVDVTGGSDEEIDQMGEEFSIHPLALEDCHHQHQRPKVDQYQQHLLLVAYGTEAAIQGRADPAARAGPGRRGELFGHLPPGPTDRRANGR